MASRTISATCLRTASSESPVSNDPPLNNVARTSAPLMSRTSMLPVRYMRVWKSMRFPLPRSVRFFPSLLRDSAVSQRNPVAPDLSAAYLLVTSRNASP